MFDQEQSLWSAGIRISVFTCSYNVLNMYLSTRGVCLVPSRSDTSGVLDCPTSCKFYRKVLVYKEKKAKRK